MTEFEDPTPIIERDRGRPKIKQSDGSVQTYSRISTFAKALDNGYGLIEHKLRHLAVGLGRREDLAAMAAGLSPDDKENLDPIIDAALDYAGMNARRNYGTAVHTFTEPGAIDYAPERMKPDIAAYNAAVEREGLQVVETELFVVNDTYQVAGTLDHIYRHPVYGNLVGDKKTGTLRYPCHAIQVATYANSQRYDIRTGKRTPLDVNTELGYIVHIPNGAGTCEFILRDIRAGWDAAACAVVTRKWQTDKEKPFIIADAATQAMDNLQAGGLIGEPLIAQIDAAISEDDLVNIWRIHKAKWNDTLTAAYVARRQQLGGVTV